MQHVHRWVLALAHAHRRALAEHTCAHMCVCVCVGHEQGVHGVPHAEAWLQEDVYIQAWAKSAIAYLAASTPLSVGCTVATSRAASTFPCDHPP